MNSIGEIKITNFGLEKSSSRAITTTVSADDGDLNRIVSGSSHATTVVGTLIYMSPERLLGKPYDHSSDIYSLGLTMMATALGRDPTSTGYWSLMTDIEADNRHPQSLPMDDNRWSEELRDFLNLCLKKDLEERPTTCTLLTHNFITYYSLDDVNLLHTPISDSNNDCALEMEQLLNAIAEKAGQNLDRPMNINLTWNNTQN